MNWSALLSTFGLVFIAELGDKTQLAVMTQTCKFRRPWPVFLGGSLALTAVTALGAVGGRVLGEFVPAEIIRLVAAVAFVVMGLLIWREAARSKDAECASNVECVEDAARAAKLNWQAFGTTFTLLFFAELGDKTQLAVLGLSSKQSAGLVFAGGALALMVVTALGVVGGQQLTRCIPEKLLLKISAAAFVVMGVLMGFGVL
ncbi:MAG TPA: TMEM165/GDT1 family protein [Anaerolineae bacterium]|nr:TMEM165/GDT1 family protein [Anaerolineae bacterium]